MNCEYWCPQLKFREAYGEGSTFLTFEDFQLALARTPYSVNIVFAGFAEPFMNPRTLEMIEYAKADSRTVALYSTLQGLKAEDVPRLKGKLDYFCLHLPDNKGIAHVFSTPNYEKTLSAVFHQLDIDEYSRMDRAFFGEDRAGNSNAALDQGPRKVRGPFYCRRLTNPQPVMLPNLDLQLCSMDWRLKHTVGSLRTQTYEEIVEGGLFGDIKAARLHIGGDELCRGCSNAWSWPKAAAIELGFAGYRRVYRWARAQGQV